jgi:phage baseplate assembly protein W
VQIDYPFRIDGRGRTALSDDDGHIRDMIEQVLFTSPGERVNRPDYGTRLLDLVFDPNSDVLAATMEFTITRALQQEFADDIQVDSVQLTPSDDTLLVDISYLRKADLRLEQVRIGVPLPAGGAP